MPLTLYGTLASPPYRAVFMLKELLNLNVDTVEIRPIYGENLTPEFVEKNPVHTIPFIEDGDFGLADSHAILTYLVSKYGAEHRALLYPSDLRVKATVDQRLFFDATILFPRFINPLRTILMQKLNGIPEEDVSKIKEAYGFLQRYLELNPYVATDHITVADLACVASVSTLNCMVPLEDSYPRIKEWWENLKGHDWYEKGNAEGVAVIDGLFQKVLAGELNFPSQK